MKETAKQRIRRLAQQVATLDERWHIRTCPPGLCNFCEKFWFEKYYYDNECDWGCNDKRVDGCDETIGERLACRYFKAKKDWPVSVERYLNGCLSEALSKAAPYSAGIKELQKKIDALNLILGNSQRELERSKANYELAYRHHIARLRKLVPAEVLARVSGHPIEQILNEKELTIL